MNNLCKQHTGYTVDDDPAVDARVQRDLDFVVSELVTLLGDEIRTILLCGGFGRGEGGVYFENGEPRPLNDYDLTVVVRHARIVRRQYGKKLGELAQRCAEQIGIKQIDLAVLSAWQFAVPRNSVVRHEMKYGHKVLYGEVDFPVRAVKAERIPLEEGTHYFFTRAGGLLISGLILDQWDRLPEGERERNFIIEMNKACMAMGDARLIRARLYCCSYQTRLERIEQLRDETGNTGSLIGGYKKAVQDKLMPSFDEIRSDRVAAWWQETVQAYLAEFLDFEQCRLKRSFKGLSDYADYVIQWRVNFVSKIRRKIQGVVLRRSAGADEDRMRAVVMLLLAGRRDPECLREATQLLDSPGTEWSNAARQYLLRWHPEGFVKELVTEQRK
jgi:hypothetical protein